MKLSLIQVHEETKDGRISGTWIQDHHGTLETALIKAMATEKANSNRIKIAITEQINGSAPNYNFLTGLKRLG